MRGEVNPYRFEISNRRENKFCSHEAVFQNDPITWTCAGISFRVVFRCYWNFISLKMTDMKSTSALSFKRTCALNATSNESALIHFVSGKLCSHENLMPVWNFISKWPIWNPYRFEFHFASIHVNTSKELTEHRSEIFNRNEISYRFEFISPLMWTYSSLAALLCFMVNNAITVTDFGINKHFNGCIPAGMKLPAQS